MSRKRPSQRQPQRQVKAARKSQRGGLYLIGGVVALALVVTVLLIINNTRPPASAGDFITVEKKTWPQPDGKALGSADLPVVVSEFSDFQCPFCAQFTSKVQGRIIEEYVATGKVRFEYKHFIVIDNNVGGNESRRAAQASECAAEQGAFWDYHEMLFANQQGEGTGAFSDTRLKAFAGALDLDTAKFNSCFDSSRYASRVTADEALGRTLGIRGTPGLYINNRPVENPMDYTAVKAAIDTAIAAAND